MDDLAVACRVLEMLADTPRDGFLRYWRNRSAQFAVAAAEELACIERVISDPPADLVQRLRDGTGFTLNHVTPSRVWPYTHDDVIAWLRGLHAEMASPSPG